MDKTLELAVVREALQSRLLTQCEWHCGTFLTFMFL